MKRCVSIGLAAFLAVAAYAVIVHHARGRGFIVPGEGHRGTFDFEVTKREDNVLGSLVYRDQTRERMFAAVRVEHVRFAQFGEHFVEFGGPGTLNGHAVQVMCRASDGGEKGDDFLRIVVRRNDNVLYQAQGVVREGNIVIRHADR